VKRLIVAVAALLALGGASVAEAGRARQGARQRLASGASNMTRPGAALIAWYLNPARGAKGRGQPSRAGFSVLGGEPLAALEL